MLWAPRSSFIHAVKRPMTSTWRLSPVKCVHGSFTTHVTLKKGLLFPVGPRACVCLCVVCLSCLCGFSAAPSGYTRSPVSWCRFGRPHCLALLLCSVCERSSRRREGEAEAAWEIKVREFDGECERRWEDSEDLSECCSALLRKAIVWMAGWCEVSAGKICSKRTDRGRLVTCSNAMEVQSTCGGAEDKLRGRRSSTAVSPWLFIEMKSWQIINICVHKQTQRRYTEAWRDKSGEAFSS